MSNPIRQIVTYLNSFLESSLDIAGVTYHGLTELVERNGETFPVPEFQDRAKMIFPDSKKPLQIYHRINSITENESPNAFGFDRKTRTVAGMSLFGVGDQSEIKKQLDGINTDVAYQVFSTLPRANFNISTDIENVNIVTPSLVTDKDTILQGEYRGNGRIASTKLSLVAFRIDYSIQADTCTLCGEDLDLTANCDDVIVTDGDDTVNLRPGAEYTCTSGGAAPQYDELFAFTGNPRLGLTQFLASANFELTGITNTINAANIVVRVGAATKSVGDDIFAGDVVSIECEHSPAPNGTSQVQITGDLKATSNPLTLVQWQYGEWEAMVSCEAFNQDRLSFHDSGLKSTASGVNTARLTVALIQPFRIEWKSSKQVYFGLIRSATAPAATSDFEWAMRDGGNNIFVEEGGAQPFSMSREGGDRLAIAGASNQINYYMEDSLIYTSLSTPSANDVFYVHMYYNASASNVGQEKVSYVNLQGVNQ